MITSWSDHESSDVQLAVKAKMKAFFFCKKLFWLKLVSQLQNRLHSFPEILNFRYFICLFVSLKGFVYTEYAVQVFRISKGMNFSIERRAALHFVMTGILFFFSNRRWQYGQGF